MVCPEHWSGKDEYGIYPDCHVWTPYYTISDSILLVFAIVNGTIAAVKHYRGRGALCKYMACHSLFLIINCIIRLCTGWTTIDKKLPLNAVLGLSLGFFWCGLILFISKYLELVMMTKRLRGVSQTMLFRTRCIWTIVLIFCFSSNLMVLVGPSVSTRLNFVPLNWWFNIVRGNFLTVIFLFFGLQVRRTLNSMELSKTFYQVLRHRLDLMMLGFLGFDLSVSFFVIMAFTVNLFVLNQYVLVPIYLLVVNLLCLMILIITQAPRPEDSESQTSNRSRSNTAASKTQAQLTTHPKPDRLGHSGHELLTISSPSSPHSSAHNTVIDSSHISPSTSEIHHSHTHTTTPKSITTKTSPYRPIYTRLGLGGGGGATTTPPSPQLRPDMNDIFNPNNIIDSENDTNNNNNPNNENKADMKLINKLKMSSSLNSEGFTNPNEDSSLRSFTPEPRSTRTYTASGHTEFNTISGIRNLQTVDWSYDPEISTSRSNFSPDAFNEQQRLNINNNDPLTPITDIGENSLLLQDTPPILEEGGIEMSQMAPVQEEGELPKVPLEEDWSVQ